MTLLSTEAVADLLGVSKKWIYDRAKDNVIPHYKVGGLLRFDTEEINQWLEVHHRGPVA